MDRLIEEANIRPEQRRQLARLLDTEGGWRRFQNEVRDNMEAQSTAAEAVVRRINISEIRGTIQHGNGHNAKLAEAIQKALKGSEPGTRVHAALTRMQREYGEGTASDRSTINEQISGAYTELAKRAYEEVGRRIAGNVQLDGSSSHNADVHTAIQRAAREVKDPYLQDFLERQNLDYQPGTDCRKWNQAVRDGKARVERMAPGEAVVRQLPVRDLESLDHGNGYQANVAKAIREALKGSKEGPLRDALTAMQRDYVEGNEAAKNRARINKQIGEASVDIADRAYDEVGRVIVESGDVHINRGVGAHAFNPDVDAAFEFAIKETKDPYLRDFLERQRALYQEAGRDCSDFNNSAQEAKGRVAQRAVGPDTDGEALATTEAPRRTMLEGGVASLENPGSPVPARAPLRPDELRALGNLKEHLEKEKETAQKANQVERVAELEQQLKTLETALNDPRVRERMANELPENRGPLLKNAAGSIGALLLIIAAAKQAAATLEHDTTNLPQPKPRIY